MLRTQAAERLRAGLADQRIPNQVTLELNRVFGSLNFDWCGFRPTRLIWKTVSTVDRRQQVLRFDYKADQLWITVKDKTGARTTVLDCTREEDDGTKTNIIPTLGPKISAAIKACATSLNNQD